MQAGLKELEIDLERTDIFLTHLHADHTGLVSRLATKNSLVYFNEPDLSDSKSGWDKMLAFAVANGFPQDQLEAALKNHPGYKYSPEKMPDYTILKDGDKLNIGTYHFTCIQTPGHTRGHMCLYDADKRLLISGDHILNDITPNIACFSEQGNPLQDYLNSLNRIERLAIDIVLPGHRSIMNNPMARIEELKNHHSQRALEILKILKSEPQSAFQVASKMTWDINYKSWDMFPVSQKWFATGEAIAHLRFLENNGEIKKELDGQVFLFGINR